MIEPNEGVRALANAHYPVPGLTTWDYTVVKLQPPDGLVVELPDGSRWNVSVHPGVPLDVTHA